MEVVIEKTANAYRRGGLLEVVDKGSDLLLSRSSAAYCWKKSRQYNRYIDDLTASGLGQPLTKAPLERAKSSDTVFIFGSGSSINEISDAEWDVIDRHDSIGLNRWPIHEYTPTFYVFEIPGLDNGPGMRRQFWNLLERRKDAYSDAVKILKDIDRFYRTSSVANIPEWLVTDVHLSPDFLLPPLLGSSRQRFRSILRYLMASHRFAQDGRLKSLFKKRGSISYTLFLATIMGYENVVLCGVDMVDSRYFWDDHRERLGEQDVPIPEPDVDREPDEVHRTNDRSRQGIPLEEVIYDINHEILTPNGIELLTATKRSALYPEVPYYDIGDREKT